jgi:hypothetical protein
MSVLADPLTWITLVLLVVIVRAGFDARAYVRETHTDPTVVAIESYYATRSGKVHVTRKGPGMTFLDDLRELDRAFQHDETQAAHNQACDRLDMARREIALTNKKTAPGREPGAVVAAHGAHHAPQH